MMPFLLKSGIHVACVGNHDFDGGVDRLAELIERCPFPWLFSNVKGKEDRKPLSNCKEWHIIQHAGYKVGLMGLAEYEWLETIGTFFLETAEYEDFIACANRLQHYL